MARTLKSVAVISKNLTHEERRARQNREEKLKGLGDKLKLSTHRNRK